MNAHPAPDSLPRLARLLLWIVCFVACAMAGWYAARLFLLSDFYFWNLLRTARRSCPEGWFGLFAGLSLVAIGVFCMKIHCRLIAAIICGLGAGFGSMSGVYIFVTKIMPSC